MIVTSSCYVNIACLTVFHLTSILAAGFDLYIEGYGKYKTSFKAVECPTVPGKDGNIQFRFTGSNPWSMKLQARNSK